MQVRKQYKIAFVHDLFMFPLCCPPAPAGAFFLIRFVDCLVKAQAVADFFQVFGFLFHFSDG